MDIAIQKELRRIADELHRTNQILDRMANSPMFYTKEQLLDFSKEYQEFMTKEYIDGLEDF